MDFIEKDIMKTVDKLRAYIKVWYGDGMYGDNGILTGAKDGTD